jgi:hypothetical protein
MLRMEIFLQRHSFATLEDHSSAQERMSLTRPHSLLKDIEIIFLNAGTHHFVDS